MQILLLLTLLCSSLFLDWHTHARQAPIPHAIFSSIDVTNEKRSEAVFNLITNQEYDFVVLLHTDTSKVEFLSLNSRLQSEYRDVFGGLGHLYDLDESRKYAAEHWVDAEDKEEYL